MQHFHIRISRKDDIFALNVVQSSSYIIPNISIKVQTWRNLSCYWRKQRVSFGQCLHIHIWTPTDVTSLCWINLSNNQLREFLTVFSTVAPLGHLNLGSSKWALHSQTWLYFLLHSYTSELNAKVSMLTVPLLTVSVLMLFYSCWKLAAVPHFTASLTAEFISGENFCIVTKFGLDFGYLDLF